MKLQLIVNTELCFFRVQARKGWGRVLDFSFILTYKMQKPLRTLERCSSHLSSNVSNDEAVKVEGS